MATTTDQSDCKYLHNPSTEREEDNDSSDDSEVSVANLNRHATKEIFVKEENETLVEEKNETLVEEENEEYSVTNLEEGNEIISDEEYNYSDDSLCSDDSCRDSDMTNVTQRSSSSLSVGSPLNRTMSLESPLNRTMSLEFPVNDDLEDIARTSSTLPQEKLENTREHFRRLCLSANDNRFSINGDRSDEIRRARRRNMSFTNSQMRKIELENQYLLKKIMAHQKPANKPIRFISTQPKISSSAINRRKLQKKIEEENMMLLRRIQEAKSCALSTNAIPGYRLTSL